MRVIRPENRARHLWSLVRPKQLVKNFLVFAAPLATGVFTDFKTVFQLVCGLTIFCLLSSCTYIINDIHDRREDALHPVKKHRPIAAGLVTVSSSLLLVGFLACSSIALSLLLPIEAAAVSLLYIFSTTLYSFVVKKIPYLEMILLAFGFVLRASYGSLIADLEPSKLFILCIFLGSLFVVVEKRLAEKRRFIDKNWWSRKVLYRYQIDRLLFIALGSGLLFLITYASWAFSVSFGPSDVNIWRLASVFPIGFVIVRFHIIAQKDKNDSPEEILLSNKLTVASCGMWLALSILAVKD